MNWRKAGLGLVLCAGSVQPIAASDYVWDLPEGFPQPLVPADNPMTIEKVTLGRKLFYDKRLSGNGSQACGSCHLQSRAFSDGLKTSIGSTGQIHPRNSMSLANVAYSPSLTWANNLLPDLETQHLVPLFGEDPVEQGLAGKEEEVFSRLASDQSYPGMFEEAFPESSQAFSIDQIVKAIASFVRTMISGNAPYDLFVNGRDDEALSESAIRGGQLFFGEKLECFHCHGGAMFFGPIVRAGDQNPEKSVFFNTGLYNIGGSGAYPTNNVGLLTLTGIPEDMGKFKTVTLRNIELTAPYMHDGSIATLEEVLDHYAAGGRTIEEGPFAGIGNESPFKDPRFVRGFIMTSQEKVDVINFLKSLNDEVFLDNQLLSDPFCPGDCDYNSEVTVDEIISGVSIALGELGVGYCGLMDSTQDSKVDVTEVIAAISHALDGCPRVVAE